MHILYGLHRAIYGIYRGIGINVLRFLGKLQNVREFSPKKVQEAQNPLQFAIFGAVRG